jgi:hypothetical protein
MLRPVTPALPNALPGLKGSELLIEEFSLLPVE